MKHRIEHSRRSLIKKSALGMRAPSIGMTAISYGRILGANGRANVVAVGYSGGFKGSLGKALLKHKDSMNIDFG